METFGDKIKQKISTNLVCEICDYSTSRKSNMDNHTNSAKHKLLTIGDTNKQILSKIKQNNNNFICEICNKQYMSRNGLWKHKKTCNIILIENNNEPTEKELIMMLLKQNAQLIEQNAELVKNGTTNQSHNNNNTNSHNKTFNLQFFLNETCKDAMNIMDFVDSIQLQLSDLENVGKLGYVKGISNIIVKNLKELDIEKRPVHCTDKKRETMYVKDENKWEKDEENKKIRKAIKRVVFKNQRLFPKFKEAHPDCNTYHSKFSDQYNKLILESCGGSGDNDLEKEEKIIQNISKNVLVEKDTSTL